MVWGAGKFVVKTARVYRERIHKKVIITEESMCYHTPVMGNSGEQKAASMHPYTGKPTPVHVWPKHDICHLWIETNS